MGQTVKATRENRTITVDFQDQTTYFRLLDDTKAFVEFVLAFFLSLGFQVVLEDNNGHLKQLAALCPPRPRASHEPLLEGPLPVSCRGAGPGGPA